MIIIPSPTATSAAAIAIENSAKVCPCTLDSPREKATSYRLAAYAIISIAKIILIALRLATIP
jgi:hypothetical protein